jgi:hypothetical protein
MIKKCTLVFTLSIVYSCLILMKLESSRQIFVTSSNIKFYENQSSGSPVVPCGRTDGQSWRRFSQSCERTYYRRYGDSRILIDKQSLLSMCTNYKTRSQWKTCVHGQMVTMRPQSSGVAIYTARISRMLPNIRSKFLRWFYTPFVTYLHTSWRVHRVHMFT